MRPSAFRPGLMLWALCACFFLIPHAAAAGEPSLAVDFDGDGRRDSVRLDQHRPSVLQVWLSASGTTQVLVSRRPLQSVAATDLDGDNRPELIASDNQSRIHIWTPQPRGFRRYHPRRSIPKSLASPTGHRVDGRGREPDEATAGTPVPPSLPRAFFQAPADDAASACAPQDESACAVSPAVQPFSARPPPALHHARPVRRRV